jgi:hypothetical protein
MAAVGNLSQADLQTLIEALRPVIQQELLNETLSYSNPVVQDYAKNLDAVGSASALPPCVSYLRIV